MALDPCNREVLVSPVHPRILEIQLRIVEPHQDAHFVARPVLELIDLVFDTEGGRHMPGCGMIPVFDDDRRFEGVPWMLVKPAPEHLAVLRPLIESIRSGVNTDETLAFLLDEGHE